MVIKILSAKVFIRSVITCKQRPYWIIFFYFSVCYYLQQRRFGLDDIK